MTPVSAEVYAEARRCFPDFNKKDPDLKDFILRVLDQRADYEEMLTRMDRKALSARKQAAEVNEQIAEAYRLAGDEAEADRILGVRSSLKVKAHKALTQVQVDTRLLSSPGTKGIDLDNLTPRQADAWERMQRYFKALDELNNRAIAEDKRKNEGRKIYAR